jgi:hypothetical protein
MRVINVENRPYDPIPRNPRGCSASPSGTAGDSSIFGIRVKIEIDELIVPLQPWS